MGIKMKAILLFLVSAFILVALSEKLEDDQDHPKSTINIRFKRQAPKETHMRKPTINLVNTLNIRPLIPGNHVKVLNPAIHNANNVKAKRPIIVMNKLKTPISQGDRNNKTTENNKHDEFHGSNVTDVPKSVDEEHKINENVKKLHTEKVLTDSGAKKIQHPTEKDKVECPNEENKIKFNKEKTEEKAPPKLESRSMLKENVTTPELESKSKLDTNNNTNLEHNKTEQLSNAESKVHKHKNKETVKNIIKEKSEEKNSTSKQKFIKIIQDVAQKPMKNESEQKSEVIPKTEIATTIQTNTTNDTVENSEKSNVSRVPLVMTLDNSLKLEGDEELVISNNDYEELLENPSEYGPPKLIQTELRAPQAWPEINNQNQYNQNLHDDQLRNYNSYISNTYNGLKNEYNYGLQPQGQWIYQEKPGRVWRAWRNNQIFIRPQYSTNVRPLINQQSTPLNSIRLPLTNSIRFPSISSLSSPSIFPNIASSRPYPYISNQRYSKSYPNIVPRLSSLDVGPLADLGFQSTSPYLPITSREFPNIPLSSYNSDQYKYSNVPSYTFGSSQVNQNSYYTQPSCSCGFHGF